MGCSIYNKANIVSLWEGHDNNTVVAKYNYKAVNKKKEKQVIRNRRLKMCNKIL